MNEQETLIVLDTRRADFLYKERKSTDSTGFEIDLYQGDERCRLVFKSRLEAARFFSEQTSMLIRNS
jgi:hypothetical protein